MTAELTFVDPDERFNRPLARRFVAASFLAQSKAAGWPRFQGLLSGANTAMTRAWATGDPLVVSQVATVLRAVTTRWLRDPTHWETVDRASTFDSMVDDLREYARERGVVEP